METYTVELCTLSTMVLGAGRHILGLPALVPHLQSCEQEVMEAPCMDGVHHVTDQVDLSSQMLDSRESTMTTKERRRGALQTDTPQLGVQLWPRGLDTSGMAPALS